MARDIGGYFDKLTKKARGGRRLEGDSKHTPTYQQSETTGSASRAQPSRGGGLGDVLKDILGKGRRKATNTASKAREQVAKRTQQRDTKKERTLPPEGVVTVEYSPRMDGDPDPGEVVWTWVPYEEDPSQGKDRPVVVIGRRSGALVGVPLTTKENDREAQIAIGTGEWDPERRQSYARIWKMLDIDIQKTRREGAILQRRRFDEIITAVDRYYDIRRPAAATRDNVEYDY